MPTKKTTYELSLWQETLFVRASDGQKMNTYTWDTQRHNNADYELHIILEGACSLDVENNTYILRPKQAVLISPGCYHHPQTKPGAFERFVLNFTVANGKLLKALQFHVPLCQVLTLPDHMIAICRSMIYEGAAGNAFRHELIQALLTQLMISILRLAGLSEQPYAEKHTYSAQDRIGTIDNFFEKYMTERAGETLLAQQLHLSKRQLARVLQKNYGMSFRQKLICSRMEHAAWLLRSTGQHISEISSYVGYSSEAAFYQAFRKHFLLTPQQYRSQFCKHPR